MSNEISAQVGLAVKVGGVLRQLASHSLTLDQAAEGVYGGTMTVGTSAEALATGDLTSEGLIYMWNLDDTNFVEWGPDSSGLVPIGKLLPADDLPAMFRLKPGVTVDVKADTAACEILYFILEA